MFASKIGRYNSKPIFFNFTMTTIGEVAEAILTLGSTIGELISFHDPGVELYIYEAFNNLKSICNLLDICLYNIVSAKLHINCLKYPVERCKVSSVDDREISKYSSYASSTNTILEPLPTSIIDKYSLAAYHSNSEQEQDKIWQQYVQGLAEDVEKFAKKRGWLDYYTSKKIGISLLTELGELAEVIEWHAHDKDVADDILLLDKLAIEIADVTIYLLHLTCLFFFDFEEFYGDNLELKEMISLDPN